MKDTNLDATSRIVDPEQLEFDEECRPVIGQNVAIDQGKAEVYAAFADVLGETDVTGVPRVMNGAIDIGALEADWRPVYAKDVTRSGRFTVVDVTSNVVETAAGTVGINPNQTLVATWKGNSGRDVDYTVGVKVTGAGTLTVRFGEETRVVTDTAGAVSTLTFTSALAQNELTLSYEGEGLAEFVKAERQTGLTMMLR